ncbi:MULTISPECIES: hypothetical protein [unclassified Arthrobacter]|uniref:hypothetical protein n=1 Tax=unclassified Arthrobacter TaxID=235627 RepID=UPI00159D79F1|nr:MULTISPECIES: hypothetical protein [unclassified Arthrobacter]MCQ9165037.1 hypothetical protein [Arthrobacter sp. STN4]NVM98898.1 hypothetical protein [Arthrobacter sp. SDTb3-6]
MRIAAGMPGAKRARRLSLIAAIGIGAIAFTGCSAINEQSTTKIKVVSDGVDANVGSLELRNVLVISQGSDAPGRVLGTFYNTSDSDATLTISGDQGSQTEVTVKPGVPLVLNGASDKAILSTVTAAPGATEVLQLRGSGATTDSTSLTVPVLDGTLAEYKDMLPTAKATP